MHSHALFTQAVSTLPPDLLERPSPIPGFAAHRPKSGLVQHWNQHGRAQNQDGRVGFSGQFNGPESARLTQDFNQTLWNDLESPASLNWSARVTILSTLPASPWMWTSKPGAPRRSPPRCLAFGKTEAINSNLVITARLFDIGKPRQSQRYRQALRRHLERDLDAAKRLTALPTRSCRRWEAGSPGFI